MTKNTYNLLNCGHVFGETLHMHIYIYIYKERGRYDIQTESTVFNNLWCSASHFFFLHYRNWNIFFPRYDERIDVVWAMFSYKTSIQHKGEAADITVGQTTWISMKHLSVRYESYCPYEFWQFYLSTFNSSMTGFA